MKRLIKTGPLFTDLYELTMAQCYFTEKITSEATFTLFTRGYPGARNYYIAAGLEEALAEILDYTFSEEDLYYLRQTGYFTDDFLEFLKDFRFTGTIRSMPEGAVFFADEPVMEVSGPILEAQLLETFLINTIGFSSLIATKAARCVHAAKGRGLVDFSLRRNQGTDAGIKVAKSCYIAGFSATSNVLAGKMYGIPISGTMAHSYVSAYENELDAFSAFARIYPNNTVLLIDTYDTIEGAKNAVRIGLQMRDKGHVLKGVRLDSGDMAELSKQVRKILDDAGLVDVKIFASSGFDEYKIKRVIEEGAKIDAFGVGTKLGVSADAPYLDMVYKLAHFGERDIKKLSTGKVNLAGKKQVFRKSDPDGLFTEDIIGLEDDDIANTAPVLQTVVKNGKLAGDVPDIERARKFCASELLRLPDALKTVEAKSRYRVSLSPRLKSVQEKLDSRH